MTHSAPDDEVRERAALYSLGALSEPEARDFEAHVRGGCAVCRNEVGAFQEVAGNLAYAAGNAEPSGRVRQTLEGSLTARRQAAVFSIGAEQGEWKEVMSGVLVKRLFLDQTTGLGTSLVRMSPGSMLPAHRHRSVEQFYVLEGDCNVHGEVLGPGDFHVATTDTIHEATFTVNGTLFLLVAPEEYDILDQAGAK